MMALFTCPCGEQMVTGRNFVPDGWTFANHWRCAKCSEPKKRRPASKVKRKAKR